MGQLPLDPVGEDSRQDKVLVCADLLSHDPMDGVVETLRSRFLALRPLFDERTRRLWAATEARAIGCGGIARVVEATGMSRGTVRAGPKELESGTPVMLACDPVAGRRRRPGGGRKRVTDLDPELTAALDRQLEPVTRGDPDSPLRWTCNSAARLAAQRAAERHPVSERTVNRLLHAPGYSLQSNRKTLEGHQHPDRDAQFRRIDRRVRAFQKLCHPAVSVDTRKKELVGADHSGGRERRPNGEPEAVNVHDFPDPDLGEAIPYGVYDLTANTGWVSVGIDHDTATFAVETVRRWWRHMGRPLYPDARRLLTTADGGGSNSNRDRLWKLELQQLADELGLTVPVAHFPPGTSKWNRIEHRMFSHITRNRHGRLLVSYRVIVNLIAATTTGTGRTIRFDPDENSYPLGVRVTDNQMESLSIRRDAFHGEWNYGLSPRP